MFAWFFVLLVSYIFKESLLFLFLKQSLYFAVSDKVPYLIFTDVTEVFSVYVSLIFFFGNQSLIFYLLYHALIFFSSGLYRFEYCCLVFIFKAGFFIFFLSVTLCNNILFPFSWNFFFNFRYFLTTESLTIHFEAKLLEYFVFYTNFYYLCVSYFQIILLFILFFSYANQEVLRFLFFRKFFYYFFVITSTLVTPPDVLSQLMLSTCLAFCYEILIFFIVLKGFVKKKQLN